MVAFCIYMGLLITFLNGLFWLGRRNMAVEQAYRGKLQDMSCLTVRNRLRRK